MNSYSPPSYYDKTLKDLNTRYYSVIENLAKFFPRTKLYPEFEAYSKPFTKDTGEMTKLQSDFFMFKNDLESDIDHLDKDIRSVNEQIASTEKENKELSAKLAALRNTNDASYGMLQDTKLLYNQLLTGNWVLFFISIGLVYNYYRKDISSSLSVTL
jgi:hypothetical protein